MKYFIFFILANLAIMNIIFSQTLTEKEKRFEGKLKNSALVKDIRKEKDEYTRLVVKLKVHHKDTEDLKKAYDEAQQSYNKAIETMIIDVKNANTIGGLVEEFIKKKARQKEYKKLLDEAHEKGKLFLKPAYKTVEEQQGLVKDIIDFVVGAFIPSAVKDLTDKSLEFVSSLVASEYEKVKFSDWDTIK